MLLRGFLLPVNVVVFSTYFLLYSIRQDKSAELWERLTELEPESATVMFEHLTAEGIWSIERLVATPRAYYPAELTRTKTARQLMFSVKDEIRNRFYTRLWLKDKGLERFLDFERVESLPPLDEMAYWYPGEINNAINSHTLDVAERHVLKDGVNRFKAAMSQLRLRSTTVVTKLLEYDRKFAKDAEHYSAENIKRYIQQKYLGAMDWAWVMEMAKVVMFVLGNHYLVSRGTPRSVPGTSDVTLSIALFYVSPEFGQLNLYVILFYRLFLDPVKCLVLYALLLETWMQAANTLRDDRHYLIILSVMPTVVFGVFLKVLKFQPVIVRRQESKGIVVCISGHGYVDHLVRDLLSWKHVSWASKLLLGLHIERDFDWDEVETLRVEDCDVSCATIRQLIKPSLAAGKLKNLLVIDNKCLTDDDVERLMDDLKGNESVEKLGVSFKPTRSLPAKLYHWLFWDVCDIKVARRGLLAIFKWAESRKHRVEIIDAQGIVADDECIAYAKHLLTNKKTKVLCTKREFLRSGPCVSACNNILTRALCAVIVLLHIIAQIFLFFNNKYSFAEMLPEKYAAMLGILETDSDDGVAPRMVKSTAYGGSYTWPS